MKVKSAHKLTGLVIQACRRCCATGGRLLDDDGEDGMAAAAVLVHPGPASCPLG